MRLPLDTEVYEVDNWWLGPPGRTLIWGAVRYSAYGVGFGVFLLVRAVFPDLGLDGLWVYLLDLAVTVAVTTAVMRVVSHQRPLEAVVATFAHEVTAPRPDRGESHSAVFTPSSVPQMEVRRG